VNVTDEINSKIEIKETITLKESTSESQTSHEDDSSKDSSIHIDSPTCENTQAAVPGGNTSTPAPSAIVDKYELDCVSAALEATVAKLIAAKKHKEADIASQLLVDLHEGKISPRETEQILAKLDRTVVSGSTSANASANANTPRILALAAILVVVIVAGTYFFIRSGAVETSGNSASLTAILSTPIPSATPSTATGKNLLTDGNFRHGTSSWNVRSWAQNVQGADAETALGAFVNGVACLTCRQPDDTMLYQAVKLKPHTEYILSGWIKTQGVRVTQKGGTIGANLAVWDTWELSQSLTGTHDWTRVECPFDSGSRTICEVGARLGHHGSVSVGKAWFKDMKLVEVPPEAPSN